MDRLDSWAADRISTRSWAPLRAKFEHIARIFLSVSETAHGDLTTIYVKFVAEETSSRPYAVVWLKKSSEIVIRLALPETTRPPMLTAAKQGYGYAGLTAFLTIGHEDEVPAGNRTVGARCLRTR